jgi:putative YjhG/YagF family dehydratase
VGEALGLSLPHSALAPSGQPIWLELARRSVRALLAQAQRGLRSRDIVTAASVRNAMTVHAAFGGSTNLLLHLPAVAHAAGLPRPTVRDWIEVNRRTPRLVSVLPNGPVDHPTVRVFLAGGVPEVMLHLRELGLLELSALTATGQPLGETLDQWLASDRRRRLRQVLRDRDGVDPDEVILPPDRARAAGLAGTLAFPTGNLAPEGSVVKATSIERSLLVDGEYRLTGRARVFTSEKAAMAAIKQQGDRRVGPGDVLVLAGCGPRGTGMEETYQLTSALKHLPWGKQVPLLTDARFSGVSTGPCIGHIGPEALCGGPLGRVLDDDLIEVVIDLRQMTGRVDLVGDRDGLHGARWGSEELARRPRRDDLAEAANLPDDTRLWAALQGASGGTWGGCVYDVEAVLARLGTD